MIGAVTRNELRALLDRLAQTGLAERKYRNFYLSERGRAFVEDTAKLPYNDETFDTVTIVAALNHIPNRDEVLREIHRVLRPGGRLIITMIPPTISRVWHFLRSPWDADQHERGMQDGEVYGMRPCDVQRLLARASFQACYEKRFMLGVNRLTVATRCPSPTSAACTVSASR